MMLLIILFSSFGLLPNIQGKRFRESTKGGKVTVQGFTKYPATPPLPSHCLIPKVLQLLICGLCWHPGWTSDQDAGHGIRIHTTSMVTWVSAEVGLWGSWRFQAAFDTGNKGHSSYHSMSQVGYPRSWALGGGFRCTYLGGAML